MQGYKKLQPSSTGLFTGLIEVWRDIKGYEGCYQVSSFGRVKSLARMRASRGGSLVPMSEKIMSLKTNKHGYLCIGLHSNGKKFFSVHRLVAFAFIPNSDELKTTVNHKNADKKDNRVSNLEWATQSEQMQHAVKNDLLEIRGSPKFTKEEKRKVLNYSQKYPDLSVLQLANIFNMSERTVGRILNQGVKARVTTCSTKKGLVEKVVTSQADVRKIKELRSKGLTLREIGEQFGLGTSQVWRICKNLSRNNNFED